MLSCGTELKEPIRLMVYGVEVLSNEPTQMHGVYGRHT